MLPVAACADPDFLQLLVTGGGGRVINAIEAQYLSTTGRLLTQEDIDFPNSADLTERPHVALVAPSHKRTLKFLQGLATLGRVPLLRATWLIDSCLVAAGKEPTMASELPLGAKNAYACADWPHQLLKRSPRNIYELPRGVDRLTNRVLPA